MGVGLWIFSIENVIVISGKLVEYYVVHKRTLTQSCIKMERRQTNPSNFPIDKIPKLFYTCVLTIQYLIELILDKILQQLQGVNPTLHLLLMILGKNQRKKKNSSLQHHSRVHFLFSQITSLALLLSIFLFVDLPFHLR